MAVVVANYDGPLFLVVAKTFYNIERITQDFSFPLPSEYYAAHFPLFPILIKAFALIAGFPYSMLFVTVASSFLAIYFFQKFIKDYVTENNSLWMTFIFAIFPARWLVVRSVGSAEPLFVAGVLASVYYFKKEKYLLSGFWGVIAAITKSPGILLFLSFLLTILLPEFKKLATSPIKNWLRSFNVKKLLPIFLIPLSVFAVFILYKMKFGDFFAYFRSGDNIHLFFPPFQIFNYSATWVGTFWLEEIIFVYLFGILGIFRMLAKERLKKPGDSAIIFTILFFISTLFVSHRDLVRYSLPIVPFLLMAYSDVLVKKEFKIALVFLIIPIYLFSLTFISQNVMPIGNWSPFL